MEGLITKPGPVNLKSGNIHASWQRFKQKFQIFLIATGKEDAPPQVKWALLMGEGGDDVLELYNSFKESLVTRSLTATGEVTEDNKSQDYNRVVETIDGYTLEKKSVTTCRENFNKRSQKSGEPFANWLTDVRNLIKDCDYKELEDSMLKDRIIWGSNERRLRETLKGKPTLKLEEVIDLCKAA